MPRGNSKLAAMKSTDNMFDNMTRHHKATNQLWKTAKYAPMFTITKTGSAGKPYTKYTRLINSRAFQVVMSGACASVSNELRVDMAAMGLEFKPESKQRPWSTALTPGAAFMTEQWLSTIVQEIMYQSRIIRDGCGRHSRNNKEVTRLAIDAVRRSIFAGGQLAPAETAVLPMAVAKKAAKKSDGTAVDESMGEQAFDPEEAEASKVDDEDEAEGADEEEDEV